MKNKILKLNRNPTPNVRPSSVRLKLNKVINTWNMVSDLTRSQSLHDDDGVHFRVTPVLSIQRFNGMKNCGHYEEAT